MQMTGSGLRCCDTGALRLSQLNEREMPTYAASLGYERRAADVGTTRRLVHGYQA